MKTLLKHYFFNISCLLFLAFTVGNMVASKGTTDPGTTWTTWNLIGTFIVIAFIMFLGYLAGLESNTKLMILEEKHGPSENLR